MPIFDPFSQRDYRRCCFAVTARSVASVTTFRCAHLQQCWSDIMHNRKLAQPLSCAVAFLASVDGGVDQLVHENVGNLRRYRVGRMCEPNRMISKFSSPLHRLSQHCQLPCFGARVGEAHRYTLTKGQGD